MPKPSMLAIKTIWEEKYVKEDCKTGGSNTTYRAMENDRNNIRQTAATDPNPIAVMYCRGGDKSEKKVSNNSNKPTK